MRNNHNVNEKADVLTSVSKNTKATSARVLRDCVYIPGGVRRGRDDARLPADGDDVGRVAPASPLAVVGVDGAALKGSHGALQTARLV